MRVRCVGAVVHDDAGRLLVVRRRNPPSADLWSIPGGRIEAGETREAAVVREVAEETGLRVDVGPLLGSVLIPADDDTVFEVDDFACTRIGTDVLVAGDDATDARWVDRAGFDALFTVPGLSRALGEWGVLPR